MRRFAVLVVACGTLVGACCAPDRKAARVGEAGEHVVSRRCPDQPAAITDPGLPAGFPNVNGVTFTGVQRVGESQLVDAWAPGELERLYKIYVFDLRNSAFRLTRAERISDDSAVDFAGERLRGQVRLRQVCRTQTTIEITVVRV